MRSTIKVLWSSHIFVNLWDFVIPIIYIKILIYASAIKNNTIFFAHFKGQKLCKDCNNKKNRRIKHSDWLYSLQSKVTPNEIYEIIAQFILFSFDILVQFLAPKLGKWRKRREEHMRKPALLKQDPRFLLELAIKMYQRLHQYDWLWYRFLRH